METSNSDSWNNIIILAVTIVLALLAIGIKYYGGLSDLLNAINGFFGFGSALLWKLTRLSILISVGIKILALAVLLFLVYKFLILTLVLILEFIEKIIFVKEQVIEIENLLLKEYPSDEETIINEIKILNGKLLFTRDYQKLKKFNENIKDRLEAYVKLLEELKKHRRLTERKEQKYQEELANRRINELNEECRIKETYEESNDDLILCKLRAEETDVFRREKLSKKQIETLEKKGFRQRTEFSPLEKRCIRVLIKQKLNHSPTHTFLVWDIKRLLEHFEGIRNIQTHLVVEADITFNFNNKKYALEIEKGSLLGKKQQQKEKIENLNKKYNKRWMIIVSNKNLLPKYKKLGFSTQRKWVSENLKKLLKTT